MHKFTYLFAFLFSILSVAQDLKSPEEFLGYQVGTQFSRHADVVAYFKYVTRVATYAALVTLYARTNRNALSSNPRGVTAWIDFGIKTWI